MEDTRPKTIFCDIDGTLVEHMMPNDVMKPDSKMKVLPGAIEKILEWERKGYHIILTTGRREGSRRQTERQLEEAGIIYDRLLMGIGGGPRYIVNDKKANGMEYAFAVNVERNIGIKDLEI